MPRADRPSPLGLTVLGLLEAGPMHPYRMERLLREWGKDQTVRVGNRANLSSAIKRLEAMGAVRVRAVEKEGSYPERTIYEITDAGHALLIESLGEMLASPRNEFPQFPAALGFIMMFSPSEAARLLRLRAGALSDTVAAIDRDLAGTPADVPRIAVIESEFQREMVLRELEWVLSTAGELESGALTWSAESFDAAAGELP